MRILCPNCSTLIANDKINVSENICVCQSCSQLFKLSEMLNQEKIEEEVTENILLNPPKGIQIQKDGSREIITISAKTKSAVILVLFSLLFSGFSAFAFYKILSVQLLIGIIFLVPFLSAIIVLWTQAFYMMFGKIELVINPKEPDYLFKGMGSLGKKHFIDWPSIKSISEITVERTNSSSRGSHYGRHTTTSTTRYLQIEGKQLIKISTNDISSDKSEFLINALKYYKEIKLRFPQW